MVKGDWMIEQFPWKRSSVLKELARNFAFVGTRVAAKRTKRSQRARRVRGGGSKEEWTPPGGRAGT